MLFYSLALLSVDTDNTKRSISLLLVVAPAVVSSLDDWLTWTTTSKSS